MNTKPRRGSALLKGLVCLFSALPLTEVMAAQLDALKVNGFLTAAFQQTDQKDTVYLPGYGVIDAAQIGTGGIRGDHIAVSPGSVAGLQFDYHMNKQTALTTQFVARGNEGWNLAAEWAYLTYNIKPDLIFKAGRMRSAFFMFSESQEVGFSYPWIRPPAEIYNTLVSAFDGVRIQKKFSAGELAGDVKFDLGSVTRQKGTGGLQTGVDLKRSGGFSSSLYYGSFTFWASALRGTVNVHIDEDDKYKALDAVLKAGDGNGYQYEKASIKTLTGTYRDAGVTFDDGSWLVIAELGKLSYDRSVQPDFVGGDITIGRRFGNWLPFYMRARVTTLHRGNELRKDVAQAFPGFVADELARLTYKQTSNTLGVRYDLSPRTDVKFQWSYVNEFGGTDGLFAPAPPSGGRANVVGLAFDAVF